MGLKYLISIVLICQYFSCSLISINPDMRKYSGYQQAAQVHPYLFLTGDANKCNIEGQKSPKVLIVHGAEIKNCLKQEAKSLVYLWHPTCEGPSCVPPAIIQDICKSNTIELFIVARSFRFETLDLIKSLDRPVYGIDTKYYSTDVVADYIPLFFNDLLGKEVELGTNTYFLFERGKLIAMTNQLQSTKEHIAN